MTVPMQITVKDIEETATIENRLRDKIEKLGKFYNNIIFCRATVEMPEKRKHQGKLYNIHIEIDIPDKPQIVVKRELDEDLYVAMRDAFKDATLQLEKCVQKQRGDVKNHQELLIGKIVRLFHEGGYGFIETPYGEEYYFNGTNVLHPAFEKLKIGDHVQFLESLGGETLQATHVSSIHRKRKE